MTRKITLSGIVTSSNDATYTRKRDQKLIVCSDVRVNLGDASAPLVASVRLYGKKVPEVGKVWDFAPETFEYSSQYDAYKMTVFG